MAWPSVFLGVMLAVGAGPEEELTMHLSMLRSQLEDKKLPIGRREQLAQEVAATLDRAAIASATGINRRNHWIEAARGLEAFNQANPAHPDEKAFALQATIYRWAVGAGLSEEAEFTPSTAAEAITTLDDAITRFERLELEASANDLPALVQSIHYRYAQALFDRAKLDPIGSEAALSKFKKATAIVAKPITVTGLKGFAELLRAQVFLALGQRERAEGALNSAMVEPIRPDPSALLEVRIEILIAARNFTDALAAIEVSKLDPTLKAASIIHVRLAQREKLDAKEDRAKIESDALQQGMTLRSSQRIESRRALLALAKAMDEPSTQESPEAFDLLAEGKLRLGDTTKAISLAAKGAERATTLNQNLKAAELRSRAGAIAFQAAKWPEAESHFAKVLMDQDAGEFRPRAGLLLALTRGKEVENRSVGGTVARYQKALDDQIKNFPDDPTAAEARWLLGKQRQANHPDEAYSLWGGIPTDHPRWLDSRLAEADARQEAVDVARAGGDRLQIKAAFETAKQALTTSATKAKDDIERIELDLRLARLLLTPGVGQPEAARSITERWVKSSTRAEQREAARRLLVVALAEVNRLVDAEREARELVVTSTDVVGLMVPTRLLDQIAIESDSEIVRRRIGMILKRLTDHLIDRVESFPRYMRAEVQLRHARALVLSGNSNAARTALTPVIAEARSLSDAQLRDLADAYVRLDAHDLAADVHRLRARQNPTGSLIWFEARYGMALGYYRAGKAQQARQLIDATALLHPELGGGELREKFERLRQRLSEK